MLKAITAATAAFLLSAPSWGAEITWNGLVTQTINQANTRVDQFQASNANVIPGSVNTQINAFQVQLTSSGNQIKALNPVPNGTVPAGFPNFTIPAVPNLPH